MEITKDSFIGDILEEYPQAAKYFFEIGMHCLGCPAARNESLEQACLAHGADLDSLLAKVKAVSEEK